MPFQIGELSMQNVRVYTGFDQELLTSTRFKSALGHRQAKTGLRNRSHINKADYDIYRQQKRHQ